MCCDALTSTALISTVASDGDTCDSVEGWSTPVSPVLDSTNPIERQYSTIGAEKQYNAI